MDEDGGTMYEGRLCVVDREASVCEARATDSVRLHFRVLLLSTLARVAHLLPLYFLLFDTHYTWLATPLR